MPPSEPWWARQGLPEPDLGMRWVYDHVRAERVAQARGTPRWEYELLASPSVLKADGVVRQTPYLIHEEEEPWLEK